MISAGTHRNADRANNFAIAASDRSTDAAGAFCALLDIQSVTASGCPPQVGLQRRDFGNRVGCDTQHAMLFEKSAGDIPRNARDDGLSEGGAMSGGRGSKFRLKRHLMGIVNLFRKEDVQLPKVKDRQMRSGVQLFGETLQKRPRRFPKLVALKCRET